MTEPLDFAERMADQLVVDTSAPVQEASLPSLKKPPSRPRIPSLPRSGFPGVRRTVPLWTASA